MKALKLSGFLILAVVFIISGCRKKFDEPPVSELPRLEANGTVADLLSKRDLVTNIPAEITTDLVIKGVIVADDRSGNFYKQIVVQDSTGGINISIDAFNLYNNYPVGREVWIQCKGLYVWNNNDLPSMGISSDPSLSRIPEALLSEYLVGGARDQPIPLKTRTFATLVDADLNTLVTFDDVQFKGSDAGATYADPVQQFSENRNVEDCSKTGVIVLRSSGYSNFAGAVTPSGSGTITAVYTVFNGTQQLVIRDLEDVAMNKSRCGGGTVVVGPVPTPNATIADLLALRDLSSNNPVEVTTDLIIKTTVVGDDRSGNFYKQLVVEDATGGVTISIDAFDLFDSYPVGREVYLKCKGLYVWNNNDLPSLGISSDPSLSRIPEASLPQFIVGGDFGKFVTPKPRTFASLVDADLNTLVTFDDVQFQGSDAGATYADAVQLFSENRIIEGCSQTGQIILRSSGYSTFAADLTPTSKGKITGVYTIFKGTQQLVIRETSDVDMTAARCAGGGGTVTNDLLNEKFSSLAPATGANLVLPGWTNYAAPGTTTKWLSREYSNNQYAEAKGYQTNAASIEAWMITPSLNLATDQYLSFQSAQAFHTHDGLSVWISTDFTGSNMATATWTQLTCTLATASDSFYDFISSGDIDLSAYTGQNAYIGFKYVGDGTTNTGTFQVDNIKVFDQ